MSDALERLLDELEDAQSRGDTKRRIAVLRELLSLGQQAGNAAAEIQALRGLGNAFQDAGDLRKAHAYRVTAAKLMDETDMDVPPRLRMAVEGDLGRSFIAVQDWKNGEEHTNAALALAEELGDQEGMCLYRLNLGLVYASTGRPEAALALGRQVVADATALGNHYLLGLQEMNLAAVYLHRFELNECQRHARRALAHAEFSGDRDTRAGAQRMLAESYRIARLIAGPAEYSADAERYFEQALELARAQGNLSLQADIHVRLGQMAEDRRRPDDAARHYRDALETLETLRGTLGYEEFQLSYFRSWQPLYDGVAEYLLRHGALEQAFHTSERLRSRLMLAMLGQERSNTGQWTAQGELRAILDAYGTERVARFRAEGTRGLTAGVRSLEGGETDDPPELVDIRSRFLRLRESQRLYRAEWQSQRVSAVASLDVIQPALRPDEALLVYQMTEASLIVFAITDRARHFQHLPYPREKLTADIEQVCAAVADQAPNTDALLQRLYALLVAPVAGVAESRRHWTIVPHGVLHRLPWAALRGRGRYLVEDHSLSFVPTAGMIVARPEREREQGREAVFFGNPDAGDPQLELPGATREVERAFAVLQAGPPPFLSAAATRGEVLARAPSASLLHIASHHLFDAALPLLSFLKLTGERGAGFLYAVEVAELNLAAQLVTLSACETARSRIETGDEQYGIVRAFLTAGVRSVISALWSIEDESAATLFADFYSQAREERLADALANAQRHLLATHPHPYFWAPYQLSGEWSEVLRLRR